MKGYLLDTHVLIWSQVEPDRLGPRTRKLLAGQGHALVVSAASVLELARLEWNADVRFLMPLRDWLVAAVKALRAEYLAVDHRVGLESYALPGDFHRDPVDRMLVATARLGALRLVTCDTRILDYLHVATVDAGK